MTVGCDAEEVMDLALVPGRGGHEPGEGGVARLAGASRVSVTSNRPVPATRAYSTVDRSARAVATSPAKRPPAPTCAATDSARWSGSTLVAKAALVVTIPSRAHGRRG